MKPIEAEFLDYWHSIWKGEGQTPALNSTQFNETRRAFYAGVFTLLSEMRTWDDSVPDGEGVRRLQKAEDECHAFYRDVKRGLK